jgi:coenzyme F420 hydrogenase subunit beta
MLVAMNDFTRLLIGDYLRVYVAWARDERIRCYSASGGVATTLLKYLLKKKYVDAVIVPSPRFKRGLTYGVWTVVREPGVLDAYSGSLYAPVYGLSKILDYTLTRFKRIAITAVPCYARAIRRILESRGRSGDVFIVGLYCNNTPSMWATKYALKYFNINVEDIERVRFRGFGWPGYTAVETMRSTIRIPFPIFWDSGFGQYFYGVGCYLCSDQIAVSADLSLADPWTLPNELIERLGGATLVVVRSERGLNVLGEAVEAGYLSTIEVDPVYAIQDAALLRLSRRALKKGDDGDRYVLPPSFTTITYELTYLIGHFLTSREGLWPLLRVYHRTVRSLTLKIASMLDYRLQTTWSRINTLVKNMQRIKLPCNCLSLMKPHVTN